MKNKQHFYLNSYKYSCYKKITLTQLLIYFNYSSKLIVLEYNGLICLKSEWDKIFVEDNDRIELVTVVGGG
jgi:sulfur carrier protein